VLPEVNINIAAPVAAAEKPSFSWLGIPLREPAGEEMSAFGLGYDDGGVLLTVVADNSMAAKCGFRSGDLLQGIDGIKIKTIGQLKDYLSEKGCVGKSHKMTVIRNQGPVTISMKAPLEPIR
jgi:S1-C subfamily serine protease